jgi:energy-coupling factor transporter ATP-binding protein EcfA2
VTIIREFRITNLAGRKGELHQVLHPKVNIFWGLNGTGKTTLLRILDAALSNKTRSLLALPFERAEVTFYSETHDMEFVRCFDNSQPTSVDDTTDEEWVLVSDFELEDGPTMRTRQTSTDPGWETGVSSTPAEAKSDSAPSEPDPLVAHYKHSYLPISRMLEPLHHGEAMQSSSADERFVRRVNQVWSRYSAKSLAEVRDIQQLGLAEILAILFGGRSQAPVLDGAESAGEEQETEAMDAYRLVSEFLQAQRIMLPLGRKDFTARYEDSDQHRHVVTRIRSIMKQIDQVLAPQQELQSVIDEMYIGNKHLVLGPARGAVGRRNIGVQINNESIPLYALSSGEKQLLQILLETLAVGESTIMIDEPELSLHPDWQKGLVGSMRRVNSDAQFLLATHSPELMVGVDDDCVFEL